MSKVKNCFNESAISNSCYILINIIFHLMKFNNKTQNS